MIDNDMITETSVRKLLADASTLIINNVVSGPRPDPEELFLMGEIYREIWEEHDKPEVMRPGETESDPDWAYLLDPPKCP